MRAFGAVAPDDGAAARIADAAERAGLRTHRAGPCVVAWDPAARPALGLAAGDDGSFVLLDGEVFDAGVGDLLAAGSVAAIGDHHLEAAVTWWDARTGTAHVVRDRAGVSPAYVGRAGTAVVWAADHDSLLAAGVPAEPDPVAVDQLLAMGFVTPPRSYLRDAQTIPAGHAAAVRPGVAPRLEAWAAHTSSPAVEGDAASAALGEAVVAAVARRAGGGRLGAFLSAGVDSAVVVAVLRKVLGLDVDTFTFRYLGYEGQLNEDDFAAETARLLGAPHHRIEVHPTDLAERLPAIVAAYQGPISFGVHSCKQDLLRELGIDVVLGGSDPGMWHDHGPNGSVAALLRRLPAGAQLRALAAGRRLRSVPKAGALHWGGLLAVNGMMVEYATPAERRALQPAVGDAGRLASAEALAAATRRYAGEPVAHRTGFVFQERAIPEYVGLWNHRWGRAFGHPVRAPLWDRDVVAVVDRRRPRSGDKPILRAFAETLLPHDRAHAPKIFQEVPLGHWFRGPLRDFVHDALSPARLEQAGLLRPGAVRAIVDDHLAGADRVWPIWGAITATEWALQLRARRPSALAP